MKKAIKRTLALMIALLMTLSGTAVAEPVEAVVASASVEAEVSEAEAFLSDDADAGEGESVSAEAEPAEGEGEPVPAEAESAEGKGESVSAEAEPAEDEGESVSAEAESTEGEAEEKPADGLSLEDVDEEIAEEAEEVDLPEIVEEAPADAGESTPAYDSAVIFPGADIGDNDALLDAYVQRMIDASLGIAPSARYYSARDYFDGNRQIYDNLKGQIVKIAAGERSAVFSFDDINALQRWGIKYDYTAGDLGVDSLEQSGPPTQEEMDLVADRVNDELGRVVDALMADYPCEMYWYDKTDTGGIQMSFSFSRVPVMSEEGGSYDTRYHVIQMSSLTFTLGVTEAYMGSDAYTVNPDILGSVNAAIDNAKAIAAARSGQAVPERMLSFMEEICGLTSYNFAAADDESTPYGDPWQLIWVFDGDPNTNVVCEGYAKAFKYLCDLSGLGEDYECLLVSGWMDGGGHMWNVVRMQDDRNYLVDVTNCDSGMVGHPEALFLACADEGSVEGGYRFTPNGVSVSYVYDDDTLNTFGEAALEISDVPYNASVSTIYIHSTRSMVDYTVEINGVEQAPKLGDIDKVRAKPGDSVVIHALAKFGYALIKEDGIVATSNGKRLAKYVQDNPEKNYSFELEKLAFTMPEGDVEVTINLFSINAHNVVIHGPNGEESEYDSQCDSYDFDFGGDRFILPDYPFGETPAGMRARYTDADGKVYYEGDGIIISKVKDISLNVELVNGPAIRVSDTVIHGSIAPDVDHAVKGEDICFTVTADPGYEINKVYYQYGGRTVYVNDVIDSGDDWTEYVFTMPDAEVTLFATFRLVPNISLSVIEEEHWGDVVLMSGDEALPRDDKGDYMALDGQEVTIVATPTEQGCLKSGGLRVINGDGEEVTWEEDLFNVYGYGQTVRYTFVKQPGDVEIDVWFSENLNADGSEIAVIQPAHGTLSADFSVAAEGQVVTITAVPETGYFMQDVPVVTDAEGQAVDCWMSGDYEDENHFCFIMPDAAVTVSAVFVAAPEPEPEPEPLPVPVPEPAPVVEPVAASVPVAVPAADPILTISATRKSTRAAAEVGKVYQIDLMREVGKQFKSSKKKVATVDQNGLVTPRAAGKAKITFKVGKKKRTVSLTVKDPTVPSVVTLTAPTTAVKKGDTLVLAPSVPEGTNPGGFKWKSSNKKVASVSGNGTVTFKKKGTVTITATAKRGKKKAKIRFTVSNP